ncbi:MAG TPA: FAD binding domain-containing protein [Candidatus Cloacimonadota bacterium]|nr:FAD binding domain-containing protein [Candidatus Cloacimonadota bacterium]
MSLYKYTRIVFFLNGKRISREIPPAETTLDLVTKELGLYGTKCSCNEGDCGACTVVIASAREGAIFYEAINSCLYPAARLHGKHLITIESLGTPENLHPIQQAMLDFHATQCGYCSPGFVMSAFALFAMRPKPTREEIMAALEGNLCRCTGYDSIYKAMEDLATKTEPGQIVPGWARAVEPELFAFKEPVSYPTKECETIFAAETYYLPQSLDELTLLIRENPQHTLINGGTDIMVGVNIQRRKHKVLIDITAIPELRRIGFKADGVHLGACSTYSDLMDSGIVKTDLPWVPELTRLIASRQIRNFGTIAGNIANASPIGDSLPLLLVLDAGLSLYLEGTSRIVPLRDFFTSYKKTLLQPGEIIRDIIVPTANRGEIILTTKSAKRIAVDISAISSALRLAFLPDGTIACAYLAFGGAAETAKLSAEFSRIVCMKLEDLDIPALADAVAAEFTPLSDVRGSADYRHELIRNHLIKYFQEISAGRQA